MAPADIEAIKLQLAMALGQGSGSMLARHDALNTLLADRGQLLQRAAANWTDSRWAFVELTRILGQISAASTAAANSAEIRWLDFEHALPAVMDLCPCVDRPGGPIGTRP